MLTNIFESSLEYSQSKNYATQIITRDRYNGKEKLIDESDVYIKSKDTSDQIKKKISLFDKIKSDLSFDNIQFLNLYEDNAKNCNPIGLVIHNYITVDIDLFMKLYKQALTMISKKEKDILKTDDITTLKGWIETNIRKNGIYNEMYNIIYNDMKPNSKRFIKEIKDYKVTKQDIINSINLLNNSVKEFNEIISELKNQLNYFNAQLNTNVDIGQMNGLLNSNADEYYNTIKLNMISIRKILISNIIDMRIKFEKIRQKNARLIIKKAASYNPKMFKESTNITDTIEYSFELDGEVIDKIFKDIE